MAKKTSKTSSSKSLPKLAENALQSLAYPANQYPATSEDKPPELTQLNIIQVDSTISKLINYPLIHPIISFVYFIGGIAAATTVEWLTILMIKDIVVPAFNSIIDGIRDFNLIYENEMRRRNYMTPLD